MVSVAEIEVLVEMDTRQVERGMDTIKRKTTEMGTHHDLTLERMRSGWRQLRVTWLDAVSAVGAVSAAVGIAMVAVNALSFAFSNTAKVAQRTFDEVERDIENFTKKIDELTGRGQSFEQEEAIIKAKFAPGTKEYKEAMLGLQERMATEAYTKYGSTAALGELTAIEAQKKRIARGEPALMDQWGLARAGVTMPRDEYAYGPSAAYRESFSKTGIWPLQSELMKLQAERGTFGVDIWGETVKRQPIPGATGMYTAPGQRISDIAAIKAKLEELAREPKRIDVHIDKVVTEGNVMDISGKVAEATAAGYDPSAWRTR